jgi:hypothetical protein
MSRSPVVALFAVALMLFVGTPAASASSAVTTQNRLAKFGDDLATAWVDYAKDTQKTVRDQHIADLNTQFTKDILSCDPPANWTIDKCITAYLESLKKTPTILKFAEKMKSERMLYATGCSAALKREFPLTSDSKDKRTTQQAYELMLDTFVSARDNLRTLPPELRAPAYQSLNGIFLDLFRAASIPEKIDPTEQMDLNIKEARKRFPTSSPDLEATNKPIFTMLEAAARQVQQQAMQQKK